MQALVLVTLASLDLAPIQQEPPAAGFSLQAPDGWESREEEGARVMTPKNLGPGKLHSVLVPTLTKKVGSLKGLIDAGKETLGEIGTFKPSKDPVRAKNDAGWEYDIVIGRLEREGGAIIGQIVALQKGSDEGLVLLVSDSAETHEKYAGDFREMLRLLGGAKQAVAKGDLKFDVWRFPPPDGWTKTETAEHVSLNRIDGAEFCQLVLYKSRPPGTGSLEDEFATEWKEVLLPTFTPGTVTKLKERRVRSGVVVQGAAADTRDKKDSPYYSALYVLAPYGRVASVLVTSNTAASFAKYDKAIAGFLDSLTIDVDAIAKPVAEKAGAVGKAEEVPGRWAWSRSGDFDRHDLGVRHGYAVRQYDLKRDRTYTFHLEAWGGTFRSNEYLIIDENGTYAVDGYKLTLSPEAATSVVKNRAGEVLKKGEPRLEKVTYLWHFHFFEGIQDNQLVLTPPGLTDRDGLFAGNAMFTRSYLLSAKYNPEWKKFGK